MNGYIVSYELPATTLAAVDTYMWTTMNCSIFHLSATLERPFLARLPACLVLTFDWQVLSYIDVLRGNAKVGKRVAVIGAGGIGFDVSEYLLGEKRLEVPPERRLDDVHGFLKVM